MHLGTFSQRMTKSGSGLYELEVANWVAHQRDFVCEMMYALRLDFRPQRREYVE